MEQGLSIIITRPFVVGNTITIGDYSGVVQNIKLAYTILQTEDNEQITIPNKDIVGKILVNTFEYKIVETIIGIDYNDDPKLAIETIYGVLSSHKELAQDPKPMVGVKQFADFSINIEVRYWAPTIKYNEVQYAINLAIYDAILKNNLHIPYPTYNVVKK